MVVVSSDKPVSVIQGGVELTEKCEWKLFSKPDKTPSTMEEWIAMVVAIRRVLANAIDQGGTTLRDFVQEDGSPGYFALSLNVYAREGRACPGCGAPIRQRRIGQRRSGKAKS